MSLNRQIARQKARLAKAREFYSMNKPWSRNLAWEILEDIAELTPGNYNQAIKINIAAAVEEGDMYTAFSYLGDAAKMAIEDLEEARDEGYDVDYDDMFDE